MTRLYLFAGFAGTLLPFAAFGEWITHHDLSPVQMITVIWQQPLALFAWLDVIITALVLIIFADIEARRTGMSRRWIAPIATCCISPSLGLPLFLYLRDQHLTSSNRLLSSLQPELKR